MGTTKKTPKKATKAKKEAPSDIDPRFAPVVAAFSGAQDVGLGRMFSSSSVLSVNGKIFAMLAQDRFVAKLPKDRVEALVRDGIGVHFDPGHGRLMKEWVAVDEGAGTSWIDLAKEAYRFVKAAAKR